MADKVEYKANGINDGVLIGYDVETGGLKDCEHAVVQLAMVAVRIKDFEIMDKMKFIISPYRVKEAKKTKTLKSKGEVLASADLMQDVDEETLDKQYTKKAFEVHNISVEKMFDEGISISEASENVIKFILDNTISAKEAHKPILVGHNVPFDVGFLMQIDEIGDGFHTLNKNGNPTVIRLKDVLAGHVIRGTFIPDSIDTLWLSRLAFGDDNLTEKHSLDAATAKLGFPMYDHHDALADVEGSLNIAMHLTNIFRNGGISDNDGAIIEVKKERSSYKI